VPYSKTEPEHIDHGGLLDVLALSPEIARFAYEVALAGDLVLMAGPSIAQTPKLVALTAEAQREHLPTPEDEAGIAWRPDPFIIGDRGSPMELAAVVTSAPELHALLLPLSGA
jgi:hypothetical protein